MKNKKKFILLFLIISFFAINTVSFATDEITNNIVNLKIYENINLYVKMIAYCFIVIVIVSIIYIYINYDKEGKVKKNTYYREIPYNLEPEILQYIYYKKILSNSYYIAVLNLIKLGVFKLETLINKDNKDVQKLVYVENHNVNLKKYQNEIEKTIVKYMKKDKNGQKSIQMPELAKKLTDSGGKGYTKYEKGLKSEKRKVVRSPKRVSKKIMGFPVILLICLIIVVIILGIITKNKLAIGCIVLMIMISAIHPIFFLETERKISVWIFALCNTGIFQIVLLSLFLQSEWGLLYLAYLLIFIFIVYVLKIEKFLKKENEIIEKIKGLRRYIKDYSMLEDVDDLSYINLWEDFFILAIALKLNNKKINYYYNYGKERKTSNLGNSMQLSQNYQTYNYEMNNTFYEYQKIGRKNSEKEILEDENEQLEELDEHFEK